MFNFDRRYFLRAGTASLAVSVSGWLDRLAYAATDNPGRKRSCILLWMSGGPATIDLRDLKPGHANGWSYSQSATKAPGLIIRQHLSKIAEFGDRCAISRGMSTKEADYGRTTFLIRTGTLPQG